MAYCHNCGVETRLQAQFCAQCGAYLEQQEAPGRSEDSASAPAVLYPSRRRRGAAFLLDLLIIAVGLAILDGLLSVALGGASALVLPVLDSLAAVAYFAAFESSARQGTPGKQTLGLRVVDTRGNRVNLSSAAARNVAKYGLSHLAALGVLIGKKRLPHDFVARTVVLWRSDPRAAGAGDIPLDLDRPGARLAWTVLAAIAVVVGLSSITLRSTTANFEVLGAAMEPTLHDRQNLLVSTIAYQLHAPQRNDIVAFRAVPAGNSDRVFLERIIALPGETVKIAGGAIFVNGRVIHQPYDHTAPAYAFGPYRVPKGCYFVLGDNRNYSDDSHMWGGLPRHDIIGNVWISY